MGLLDDAIRDHLDLKRKHGAPDDEVERAEQEALGPARREAPADDFLAAEAPTMVEPPPPPPPPPADELGDEPVAEAEPLTPEEPPVDEERVLDDDPPIEDETPLDEPPLLHEPHAPTTVLDDPLDESAAPSPSRPPGPAKAEDEDLLEETPDFLQETPEHDKLWFEQKPPRDFDFD